MGGVGKGWGGVGGGEGRGGVGWGWGAADEARHAPVAQRREECGDAEPDAQLGEEEAAHRGAARCAGGEAADDEDGRLDRPWTCHGRVMDLVGHALREVRPPGCPRCRPRRRAW